MRIAAETLTRLRGNRCDELTILTNGGGAGVMAADAASHARIKLAELEPRTLERLDALLPANWSHGNPVDIIGDAPVEGYVRTLEALGDDAAAGAVLFIHGFRRDLEQRRPSAQPWCGFPGEAHPARTTRRVAVPRPAHSPVVEGRKYRQAV